MTVVARIAPRINAAKKSFLFYCLTRLPRYLRHCDPHAA